VFKTAVPTQDVTNPVDLPFIVCRMFLFYLTVCNTYSFSTRSVQLIFSVFTLIIAYMCLVSATAVSKHLSSNKR